MAINNEYVPINNQPTVTPRTVTGIFTKYIAKTLPLAFDESMSYYECLCALLEYLNETIVPDINNLNEGLEEVQNLYVTLQNYINNAMEEFETDVNNTVQSLEDFMNNYFDNLDVQEEINNKLDKMLEDGTLEHIIASYLQTQKIYSTHTEMIADASNLVNGLTVQTLGYHSMNDGGGAFYRITDTASQTDYQESVGSLYATLVVDNSELNVKQFGAYGDNTHDDTTAIQTAINYANTSDNKTIFIPNGTYLCNVLVYPNTEIKGEIDTVLKSVANNSLDVIKSYDFDDMTGTTSAIPVDKGLYNFKLTNITLDGNLTNSSAGYGIKIFGRNMKFSNVNVKNCKSGGIYTEFGTHNTPTDGDNSFYSDLLESVFEKIKIFNCTGNGWTYKGPHDSHIKYLICVKCQGWALNADNSTSGGLIIENLNSWWCDNGVFLQNGRLSNCQIDGGSYDGSGSSSTSIGLKLRDDSGGAFISNCSIGSWGVGAELGGSGHIIEGLWVRDGIVTNIHYTNLTASVLSFRVSTTKTGTNIFYIDANGANNVTGFIGSPSGNTLFNNRSPQTQGANSYNITSTLDDYIFYQLPTTGINSRGWKPVLPASNGTLIPNDKIPTATERGGVLRQTLAAFPSGEAATTDQLNTLMAALRTAGVLFHIQ